MSWLPFGGCDCLQGFQLCHSLGGGTGAGMGTLLISKVSVPQSSNKKEELTMKHLGYDECI
jgi:hypothetical protein